MSVVAIIQGRVGSTRFPNKIFADLCGKPFIWHVVNRLKYVKKIDKIILATTSNIEDDALESWAKKEGVLCFRGSELNVLDRFYNAALIHKPQTILRVTADDPFKDPKVIEDVIELFESNKLDFAYNNFPPSFPEGLDAEVFTFDALEKAYIESQDDFEKEHVTQYFYRHPEIFTQKNLLNSENLSFLRWTVDTLADFEFATNIYNKLYVYGDIFYMNQILDLINSNPKLLLINSEVKRSAMYKNIVK